MIIKRNAIGDYNVPSTQLLSAGIWLAVGFWLATIVLVIGVVTAAAMAYFFAALLGL